MLCSKGITLFSHGVLNNNYKLQAANSKEDLVQVFRDDEHATFLLYETGAFKKKLLTSDLAYKADIIRELQDGVLYTSWAGIIKTS